VGGFAQTILKVSLCASRANGRLRRRHAAASHMSVVVRTTKCLFPPWLHPKLFIARNFHQTSIKATLSVLCVMADEPGSSPFHSVALTTVNRRDSNVAQKQPPPSLLRPPVNPPSFQTPVLTFADCVSPRPSPWPSNNNRYLSTLS